MSIIVRYWNYVQDSDVLAKIDDCGPLGKWDAIDFATYGLFDPTAPTTCPGVLVIELTKGHRKPDPWSDPLVGYLAFKANQCRIHIERFCVANDYRGRHYGRLLLHTLHNECKAWARSNLIDSDCVLSAYVPALEVFTSAHNLLIAHGYHPERRERWMDFRSVFLHTRTVPKGVPQKCFRANPSPRI